MENLELKVELVKGVSLKTNEPYEFVSYYVEIGGLKVQLNPKENLGKQILDNYYKLSTN